MLARLSAASRALAGVAGWEADVARDETRRTELQRRLHKAKPLAARKEALTAVVKRKASALELAEIAEAEAILVVKKFKEDQVALTAELTTLRQELAEVTTMALAEEQAVDAPVYKKICVAWPSTTL